MYVKYTYLASSTSANLTTDVIKIICGAQDTSTLSSACDTANTVWLANSVASNWEIYDTVSTISYCLRSLNEDGITYKYVHIYNSSNYLYFDVYESWNTTTHVGTNRAASKGSLNSGTVTATVTNSQSIYILTTNRYALAFQAWQAGNAIRAGVFELQAGSPALLPSYPKSILLFGATSYSSLYIATSATYLTSYVGGLASPRVKNPIAAGDLVGTAISNPIHGNLPMVIGSGGSSTKVIDGVGTIYYFAYSLYLYYTVNNNASQLLGKVTGDIKFTGSLPSYSIGDELIVNGVNHVLIPDMSALSATTNPAFLIPKV